jgi:hypothetical protein
LKMAVFWVLALGSLVEVYQHFRGTSCLHHHQPFMMMEAASTSETSVNFYQTTWCYNPEDSHLHTHHCENLKFNLLSLGYYLTGPNPQQLICITAIFIIFYYLTIIIKNGNMWMDSDKG